MTVANVRGDRVDGVWVAHNGRNEGGWMPFATELEALRYAVRNSMNVEFVKFGESL